MASQVGLNISQTTVQWEVTSCVLAPSPGSFYRNHNRKKASPPGSFYRNRNRKKASPPGSFYRNRNRKKASPPGSFYRNPA
jgi:hypothetical protein